LSNFRVNKYKKKIMQRFDRENEKQKYKTNPTSSNKIGEKARSNPLFSFLNEENGGGTG
jgi:hypothetical protein